MTLFSNNPTLQSSAIDCAIYSFATSWTAQPIFTSVSAELPPDARYTFLSAFPFQFFATATTGFPSWFTALPTDVQSYIISVAKVETSIIDPFISSTTTTSTKTTTSASSGLSNGANAGIGFGVGIIALMLITTLLIL